MIGLKKDKRRAVKLGRKIFVSYKYKDNDVKEIPNVTQPTWPCDYVNYIKDNILSDDDIYKGEKAMKIYLRGQRMLFGHI